MQLQASQPSSVPGRSGMTSSSCYEVLALILFLIWRDLARHRQTFPEPNKNTGTPRLLFPARGVVLSASPNDEVLKASD